MAFPRVPPPPGGSGTAAGCHVHRGRSQASPQLWSPPYDPLAVSPMRVGSLVNLAASQHLTQSASGLSFANTPPPLRLKGVCVWLRKALPPAAPHPIPPGSVRAALRPPLAAHRFVARRNANPHKTAWSQNLCGFQRKGNSCDGIFSAGQSPPSPPPPSRLRCLPPPAPRCLELVLSSPSPM